MAAPRDIVDAMECVLSVYFSGVRHNLRAAFILCDEAVEMTLRARVIAAIPNLGRMSFPQLLGHNVVGMPAGVGTLRTRLDGTHKSRNDMQHNNAAATVDAQRCADAILDAMDCVEHCFPGARAALDDKLKIALRVVRVYSAQGSAAHRSGFQDGMMRHTWRGQRKSARRTEAVVSPGHRSNWGLVVMSEVAAIETILNRIGAP